MIPVRSYRSAAALFLGLNFLLSILTDRLARALASLGQKLARP